MLAEGFRALIPKVATLRQDSLALAAHYCARDIAKFNRQKHLVDISGFVSNYRRFALFRDK